MLHARLERWKRPRVHVKLGPVGSGKLICRDQRSRWLITHRKTIALQGNALINETNAGALSMKRFISFPMIHVLCKNANESIKTLFQPTTFVTWPSDSNHIRVVYDEHANKNSKDYWHDRKIRVNVRMVKNCGVRSWTFTIELITKRVWWIVKISLCTMQCYVRFCSGKCRPSSLLYASNRWKIKVTTLHTQYRICWIFALNIQFWFQSPIFTIHRHFTNLSTK